MVSRRGLQSYIRTFFECGPSQKSGQIQSLKYAFTLGNENDKSYQSTVDLNRPGYRGDLLVKVPRTQKLHSLVACNNFVQLQQVECNRLSPSGVGC